ncbi:MAG: PAS domain-containing protein [Thermodesulfobacteriota bacterium]
MKQESAFQTVLAPSETSTIDLSSLATGNFSFTAGPGSTVIRESLLGKLFEALPLPALLIQRSGIIAFANQACARFSKEYESIIDKPFSDLFPKKESQARAVSLLEEVFRTRRPHTCECLLDMRGRQIWGRMSFRSIKVSEVKAALVLVEDLTHEKAQLRTERKHNEELRREIARREATEKALRETEQRCESAIKGADASLWEWNVRTGSMVCDNRFSEILGYAAGEVRQHQDSWRKLTHPADLPVFDRCVRNHFTGESEHVDVEHRIRAKSGDWKWILTRGRVVERDDRNHPVRVVGTILDVTEHKKNRERVRALTKALINAQEKERRALALDLHDDVAQQLWALRLFLDPVRQELIQSRPDLCVSISRISKQIGDLVDVVRSISYSLRPSTLDRLGLETTIREYCADFSKRNGIKVDFFSSSMRGLTLDFDTEINLFRLVQEALNNVKKHAKARTVTVKLQGSSSRVTASIEDDGKGFAVHKEIRSALTQRKMGLWSMEQRARLLGGKLRIQSKPGRGSHISGEVPWRSDKNGSEKANPDS